METELLFEALLVAGTNQQEIEAMDAEAIGEIEVEQWEEETGDRPALPSLHLPFADLVHNLVDYSMQMHDADTGLVMTIDQVTVDMPVEINISAAPDGKVVLQGSPPTQRTETTFLPIFHQMKLRVGLDEDDKEETEIGINKNQKSELTND